MLAAGSTAFISSWGRRLALMPCPLFHFPNTVSSLTALETCPALLAVFCNVTLAIASMVDHIGNGATQFSVCHERTVHKCFIKPGLDQAVVLLVLLLHFHIESQSIPLQVQWQQADDVIYMLKSCH